jgi:hypothetical protein
MHRVLVQRGVQSMVMAVQVFGWELGGSLAVVDSIHRINKIQQHGSMVFHERNWSRDESCSSSRLDGLHNTRVVSMTTCSVYSES